MSTGFALLLILTGAMLTLGPEFVYLRDVFGQRFNTVFKFYYAAWVLFAVAAAYAMHVLVSRSGLRGLVFTSVASVLVVAGLVYPAFAIPARAGSLLRTEAQPRPTLDGIDFIRLAHPSDYAGIRWLQENAAPDAVVLEAVGGSYTYYGRVSASTGLQTVIGWPGHENQWRGGLFGELAGGREEDVREIYNTNSILRARQLLEEYGVTYIFVGSLERSPTYASEAGLRKFDEFLTVVFRDDSSGDGGVVIYRTDIDQAGGEP